jgi:hypothetical protein
MKFRPAKRDRETKKPVFQGGDVKFKAQLKGGDWNSTWGFDATTSLTNEPMTVPVTFRFGVNTYGVNVNVMAKTRAEKGGRFKN